MNTHRARGALGKYGESLAARRLARAGMTVLERNWRCGRTGEIDIVARDGDALVVVEVKTRSGDGYGHPAEAVTHAKLARLRRLAAEWLAGHDLHPRSVRVDVIAVRTARRGPATVEHLTGVL